MIARSTIPIDFAHYDVHRTEEFDRSIAETYIQFILDEKKPAHFAEAWLNTVEDFIEKLPKPTRLGAIDPMHFSAKYAHIQIPKTQTTIFLIVEQDQIYLITSGWSRSNWPERIRENEPLIERQLEMIRARIAAAKAAPGH